MKMNLILWSVLFLFGIAQIKAQCCQSTASKAQNENATQQEGKTVKIKITEMTCAGCSSHISNAITDVEGILEQKMEYPSDLATTQNDPEKTSSDAIIKVIEKTGYKAELMRENQKQEKQL